MRVKFCTERARSSGPKNRKLYSKEFLCLWRAERRVGLKSMMLKGKTIVITGATRGIGRATARLCAQEGADVGINYYRNLEGAEELAAELKTKYRIKPYLLPFDVRDPEAIKFACDDLLDQGATIQGWVNNAGVNLPGLLLTQSEEEIREQIDTNLLGPIHCCKYILEHMLEHKQGNIVNVGSVTRTRVFRGQAVYAATKGALASLTLALANEYGRKGIRVNCVEPGPVQTEMFRVFRNARR